MVKRRLVITGDDECGKVCLLYWFVHRRFPEIDVPTVFMGYVIFIEIDGQGIELELSLWEVEELGLSVMAL
ncbi:unnamed protein product [Rhizoctonia solani]|uniref:Uncharacterized protein n=1 Tax=Rhizoctonia solani TaxID=456999 RepID=A0A8H3DHN2_9AGAM|nr:unnamed protein product [Rhizoctonia solani]